MDKKSYLSARRVVRRGYRRLLSAEAALLWLQLERIRRSVDPLAQRADVQAHYLRAGRKCTARDTADMDLLTRFFRKKLDEDIVRCECQIKIMLAEQRDSMTADSAMRTMKGMNHVQGEPSPAL